MPTDPKELIASIPAAAEAVAARDDAAAAELLNAPAHLLPKSGSWLTERGVMSVVANAAIAGGATGVEAITAAETAMQGLEAAAQAHPAIARAVRWLKELSGNGIDMGDLVNQGMILSLQEGDALSELAANALLAYGSRQVGVWEKEYGRPATAEEVSKLYAQERADADNASNLEERKQAYIAAKESKDKALIERYGRELIQTLGGEAAKETIDNG